MCIYMKILVLVICYFGISHQQINDPAYIKMLNQYEQECAKEQGIDEATMDKVWVDDKIPDDPKIKCAFKCTGEKLGLLDAAGDVVDDELEKVSSHFSNPTETAEIVKNCKDIKNADLCEAAYQLVSCILKVT